MAENLPAAYKPVLHYLKIAHEHAGRDPAVYYWCECGAPGGRAAKLSACNAQASTTRSSAP